MTCFDCVRLFFAVLVVSALVGCSGDSGPPTGDLSGKVFHQDELVGDCLVAVQNPVTTRLIGGKVDLQGEFKITGIPLGDYELLVRQRTTNDVIEEPFDKRIPKKYRNSKTSGFTISIVEGENSIELKMED